MDQILSLVRTRRDEQVAARRAYAKELARLAGVYREAAGAPGLRKDAARYLESEADRLDRESKLNEEFAYEQEVGIR